MKLIFSFVSLLVLLYLPSSFAENQAEIKSDIIQVDTSKNKAVEDSVLEFTDKDNDSLRFRWLSHQREALALKQEKLHKEIIEHQQWYADLDQQKQHKDFDKVLQEIQNIEQHITGVEQTLYELKQKQVMLDEADEAAKAQFAKALEQQNKLLAIHKEQLAAAEFRQDEATRSVHNSGNELDKIETEIQQKKEEASSLAAERFKVETQISELLNRDGLKNDFRVQISIAFTVLVGIVILGFYWLAIRKDEIAKNIFVGDKGIQFITLFLIVIAIILFGIMGTLEGRELSALLGALAGYILGKTTTITDKPDVTSQNSGESLRKML